MRRLFRMLIAVAAVAAFAAPAARAATITVDTTADPQIADGSCSLRNAVVAANTDTAVNGCPAGAGSDTIVLGMGVYSLSIAPIAGDTTGQNGDLDILHTTTITGAGSAFAVINANNLTDRIFDIQPGVTATISGVGLEFGQAGTSADASHSGGDILVETSAKLTVSASAVNSGHADTLGAHGGGIYNEGTLTVLSSQLRKNSGYSGGAIASNSTSTLTVTASLVSENIASSLNPDAFGGAVYISSNGRLNASGSTFQANHAATGGAIYTSGPLTLTNDAILGNVANYFGGGIYVASGANGASTLTDDSVLRNTATYGYGGGLDLNGPLTVTTSTFNANRGFAGGAVYVESTGTLTMNRSTVSDNDGATDPAGYGDGIDNAGSANLTNVTVSGNGQASTKGLGGGIYNSGSLALLNDTVTANEASFASGDGGNIYNAGSASAQDTIIAGALTSGNCGGTAFTSLGNNLQYGDSTTCFVAPRPSDVFADPLLGLLQNNGGATKTHSIPAGSPARNTGAGCSTIDQRGVGRPQGPACDIGAYEYALCGAVLINIVGTSGNDSLNGTAAADGIFGGNGNDTINGNGGNDAICPGSGNDTATGGAGNDTFFLKDGVADSADGGTGTDTATIDSGTDTTTTIEVIH